jgi:hypothetical protein
LLNILRLIKKKKFKKFNIKNKQLDVTAALKKKKFKLNLLSLLFKLNKIILKKKKINLKKFLQFNKIFLLKVFDLSKN